MQNRVVTGHSRINQIISGHFRQEKGYYAFRPGGTDDWLVVYTISGLGRFGYDGGELTARPGDIVALQPGTMHDYGVEATRERWEMYWAHVHPRASWHEWLNWPEVAPGILHLTLHDGEVRQRVRKRFADANDLCNGPLPHAETFAMNALEEVVLWCDMENPNTQRSPIDARVRVATEYLCRNLREKITLDSLADHCRLSTSRLAHLFRDQVGYTPQQFLENQRLNRAAQLLEMTGKSIKEIAGEVGFDSPFYFTLRFKRRTGQSPTEYRRR